VAGGAAIGAACLVAAALQLLQGSNLHSRMAADSQRIEAATATYNAITGTFPPLPTNLDNLRAALEQSEALDVMSRGPERFAVQISYALDASPDVKLERFEWKGGRDNETMEIVATLPGIPAADYRAVQSLTENFANEIRKQTGLNIISTKLPFDMASRTSLSSQAFEQLSNQAPSFTLVVGKGTGS